MYYTEECPVCGKVSNWKQRMYHCKKPKKHEARYNYVQRYDWCDG